MRSLTRTFRLALGLALVALGCVLAAVGQGPTRFRLGSFSLLMPGPARLINTQNTGNSIATVYESDSPVAKFFVTLVRFNSYQQSVTPEQFAHNMTVGAAGAQVLGLWTDRLAGYPADKVLYRIGNMTVLAWSVQPDRKLNYILSVNGLDSPQFRNRAEQYALSMRVEGEHAGLKR